MPTPPEPSISETLQRIDHSLNRIASALDASLELALDQYDPELGKRLKDGLISLHAWHDRFSE
jgi:hypothetical protein